MTSRTSINGMKLISGSSRPREPLRSMAARALLALAVREVDELDGLLLHLDDQLVDLAAEMPVEDHARDRDDQAHGGVVERHRDPVGEPDRVRAHGGLRAEDLDHADDRA